MKQIGNRRQGRGQVGVPVADPIGPLVEGGEATLAHCLGLPLVAWQVQDVDVCSGLFMELVQYSQRVVAATVVDEEKTHRRMPLHECQELLGRQTAALVVTRDD